MGQKLAGLRGDAEFAQPRATWANLRSTSDAMARAAP